MSEIPNRPEPSADLSESASTQHAPEQPSAPSTEPVTPETPPAPEQPQSSQPPIDQSIPISTSLQTEPSVSTPSAQTVPTETEPIKEQNQIVQADTAPQSNPELEAPQPPSQEAAPSTSVAEPPAEPNPSPPSSPSIPSLHFPFYDSFPVTFDFGVQPTDEDVKKKYQEWGLAGHNGLDFGLPEGTEVLACDEGVVTQVGDNRDFGISVTIKHSWGTSIYAHLLSFGVLVNDHISKAQVIGASDQTGFAKGPHLHFGIQSNNPDTSNGYLGYINPTPYLTEKIEKPQPQPEIQHQPLQAKPTDLSVEKPTEPVASQPSPESQQLIPPEPQPPQSSVSPQPPQAPQVPQETQPEISDADIQRLADEKVKKQWQQFQPKGNPAKQAQKEASLQKIFAFAQEKKRITNQQVRDLLHISQSTATNYLSALVNRGMLRVEGKGKATVYLF